MVSNMAMAMKNGEMVLNMKAIFLKVLNKVMEY